MRRFFFLVLIVVAMVGILGIGLPHWNQASWQPPSRAISLQDVSFAKTDSKGNMYMIGDVKSKIYVADKDGTLLRTITMPAASGNQISQFTDMAVDDSGDVYVLVTVLDSAGLYVKHEDIFKYAPGVSKPVVIYQRKPITPVFRVGYLQDLRVIHNRIEFLYVYGSTIDTYAMHFDGTNLQHTGTLNLPANTFIALARMGSQGLVVFTTRKGAVGEVSSDGVNWLYKTAPGIGSQPRALAVDTSTLTAYFLDALQNKFISIGIEPPFIQHTIANTSVPSAIDWANMQSLDGNGLLLGVSSGDSGSTYFHMTADGHVLNQSSVLVLNTAAQWNQWKYWLLLAFEILLGLFLLRYLYAVIFRKRLYLFLQQMLLFVPISVGVMLYYQANIAESFTNQITQDSNASLPLIASQNARLISGDALQKILSTRDFMSPAYQTLKAQMQTIHDSRIPSSSGGYYNTLYTFKDHELYVVMDDDNSVQILTPFAMDASDIAVLNGQVYQSSWIDASGEWHYAIAPVKDSHGNIVGIYEVGKDLVSVERQTAKEIARLNTIQWLLLLAIAGIFILTTVLILIPIGRLGKGAMRLASGQFGAVIRARRFLHMHDEIEDLSDSFNVMSKRIKGFVDDIEHMKGSYYRFVPEPFVHALGKRDLVNVGLGDQVQTETTILVCNLRNLVELSKQISPQENFELVNEFLGVIGPAVRENNGFVSKYMGSSVLALFPESPEHAIQAATDIRRRVWQWTDKDEEGTLGKLELSMGIHWGTAMLGIIGEEDRLDTGVISQDASLTHLLEQMCAAMSATTLISEAVIKKLAETKRHHMPNFQMRDVGALWVPELGRSLHAFDVYEGDRPEMRNLKQFTKELFEQGVILFQQGRFYDARDAFVRVIHQNRFDSAAKLYFFASERMYQEGVASDWDGTLQLSYRN